MRNRFFKAAFANALVFSALSFFSCVSVFAGTSQSKTNVEWKGDQVTLCGSSARCVTVPLPDGVGAPKQVFEQKFVAQSPLSWLIATKSAMYLCALRPDSLNIACAKVWRGNLNFAISKDHEGGLRWLFQGKGPSQNVEKRAMRFLANLSLAKSHLASLLNTASSDGRVTIMSDADNTCGGTGHVSDCSDGDGEGSGDEGGGVSDNDDDGGHGSGDAGQIVLPPIITPPPIVTPPTTVPKNPEPTTPDPGYLCRTWGILCSSSDGGVDCASVKQGCIIDCADAKLPTGTWDGMPFYRCLNECMASAGCAGK